MEAHKTERYKKYRCYLNREERVMIWRGSTKVEWIRRPYDAKLDHNLVGNWMAWFEESYDSEHRSMMSLTAWNVDTLQEDNPYYIIRAMDIEV
jgi:hypothetical protein